MRVYIVGFMGAGKTLFAKELAGVLDFHFLDLDAQIEEQEGKKIREIFVDEGVEYFRKIEKDILRSTIVLDNTVISTGGGTPCFFDNMHFMTREGVTVYLRATPQKLKDRLVHGRSKRPLISELKEEQLLPFISNLLQLRQQFYERSEIIWDIKSGDTARECAQIVAKRIIPIN